MNKSANHSRVNDGFVSKLERPTLQWLAAHTPKWVTPDIYTGIGVLGSVITFVGYVLSRSNLWYLWLATFGFIVNWFGDSLDGTLARYRKIERPQYGYFVDHVIDAISQVLFLVGLGLTRYVSFNVAMFALIGFLLMSIVVYLRTFVSGEFRITYGMLGPTEARILAIILNTCMFIFARQEWTVYLGFLGKILINPYNLFIDVITFLLVYFFLDTSIRETIRLAKAGK